MHELDIRLLREAYSEALKAAGNSDPNPAVGALVADNKGNTITRGFTQRAGFAHAERMALQNIETENVAGQTLYVTLEPCCHHGRTPPCTDIILEKRIGRVVIGERDFAAEVQGKSVELLRQNGIAVDVLPENLLPHEKFYTTGPFFHARRLKRPRVVLKWAQTSDGAIAPQQGQSGKISGALAGQVTAALRNYCKFTLASPGTASIDQPRLDVRFPEAPFNAKATGFSEVFTSLIQAQTVRPGDLDEATGYKKPSRGYLTFPLAPGARQSLHDFQHNISADFLLFERSATDLRTAFHATVSSVLSELLSNGFNSVLIESGPGFSQSLIEAGLVDLLVVYKAKDRPAEKLGCQRAWQCI